MSLEPVSFGAYLFSHVPGQSLEVAFTQHTQFTQGMDLFMGQDALQFVQDHLVVDISGDTGVWHL